MPKVPFLSKVHNINGKGIGFWTDCTKNNKKKSCKIVENDI